MRSFRHWTPRYVFDRTALALHQRRHPSDPWLTARAVEFLESWLKPSDVGIEWGSGRSTAWFAGRVARLTSIEHDRVWFAKVNARLAELGVAGKVNYMLHADVGDDRRESPYVQAASTLPDGSLDFALVDGVVRDHCAAVAIEKLKPGGLLVVDNANWYLPRPRPLAPASRTLQLGFASPEWERVAASLDTWRLVWTTNGVTETALYVKPPTRP